MTTVETPVRCLTPGLITHAMCADGNGRPEFQRFEDRHRPHLVAVLR